ncbi:hypothetical protein K439DRAFT_1088445 [Ramaria rubella]|nr:hypothetical protein K439DRAFT_1088445 [Ramaria rubella]
MARDRQCSVLVCLGQMLHAQFVHVRCRICSLAAATFRFPFGRCAQAVQTPTEPDAHPNTMQYVFTILTCLSVVDLATSRAVRASGGLASSIVIVESRVPPSLGAPLSALAR